MKNLNIPIAIVIGCLVLGGFYLATQISKQNSIEKQQQIEEARIALKEKQDNCENLAVGVKKNWSNVMGLTYSALWRECVVTYEDRKTGEIRTSPLSDMVTVK